MSDCNQAIHKAKLCNEAKTALENDYELLGSEYDKLLELNTSLQTQIVMLLRKQKESNFLSQEERTDFNNQTSIFVNNEKQLGEQAEYYVSQIEAFRNLATKATDILKGEIQDLITENERLQGIIKSSSDKDVKQLFLNEVQLKANYEAKFQRQKMEIIQKFIEAEQQLKSQIDYDTKRVSELIKLNNKLSLENEELRVAKEERDQLLRTFNPKALPTKTRGGRHSSFKKRKTTRKYRQRK